MRVSSSPGAAARRRARRRRRKCAPCSTSSASGGKSRSIPDNRVARCASSQTRADAAIAADGSVDEARAAARRGVVLSWRRLRRARAQLRVLRGETLSAARDGKRIKEALERALALDPALQDAYFGIGLYHYYAEVAPAAAKILRFLLALPGGDRAGGMAARCCGPATAARSCATKPTTSSI